MSSRRALRACCADEYPMGSTRSNQKAMRVTCLKAEQQIKMHTRKRTNKDADSLIKFSNTLDEGCHVWFQPHNPLRIPLHPDFDQ